MTPSQASPACPCHHNWFIMCLLSALVEFSLGSQWRENQWPTFMESERGDSTVANYCQEYRIPTDLDRRRLLRPTHQGNAALHPRPVR
ncbi:hypothetical protein QBC36DRAFT_323401 [Triangularia setosa]|uniref:Secreted protein n=1 Tax=Triangularia setosa TaxID=2587417 RepID=A0AAN6WBM2_9PEZI|nr:hypothetical protein QBC36DRAFT_323401 [Podospora setosa]